jgi:hypothetical protein
LASWNKEERKDGTSERAKQQLRSKVIVETTRSHMVRQAGEERSSIRTGTMPGIIV